MRLAAVLRIAALAAAWWIVWTGQRAHPLLGPYDTFPDCLKGMSDYTASHPHVDVAYVRCEEHPADWKGN